MRCGRILTKGEAEEISVSRRPRSRQKHGKRSNHFSTIGLDKFQSVYAELSSKREYVANKSGVPEAMVRFVSSKKGWIPVVIGARDQEMGKNNRGGDPAGVLIPVPAENNNGEMGRELRIKDEGNDTMGGSEKQGFTVSAATIPVRAHGNPTDLCATVSLRTVNLKHSDAEYNRRHHHSEAKMLRRAVSMDNWPTVRPASPVLGPDNFCRKTRPAVPCDASVGAFAVMFITLFCFVFYGRLFAILFTSAWLYLVAVFR